MGVVIFCDIDGVLFKHHGEGASHQWTVEPTLLPNVIKLFDAWEKAGHYIILTTSRKDSHREFLEAMLLDMGLFWDQLITGLPHGRRVLLNDMKADGTPGAHAVNLPRNEGLINVSCRSSLGRGRSESPTEQSAFTDCG